MLQSMTGFGRSEFAVGDYSCSLEIRSLNGKQFELNTKLPPILKLYEIELRNVLQQKLSRGSVDVNIFLKQHGSSKPVNINLELARYYFQAIQQIAEELKLEQQDVLSTLMRMPEIVSTSAETMNEEHWKIILQHALEACDMLTRHRTQEGIMLTQIIEGNINSIKQRCLEVDPFDKNRINRIREKLQSAIQEYGQSVNADQNRLEQEIIYYIEKFDLTEEKNRLLHHCEYFFELLHGNDTTKGKKLGFLLQEIGREINTMGSKANDVDIQKLVVMMKDDLEQAKEQLLNAL
ncbi:MAG: YicC family protein [Chitinophagaceae bacterium]|nr:YicC family protein [Chitinophagaceae bacterium]